jgi:Ti-type conjugative transfer relaxase TraA
MLSIKSLGAADAGLADYYEQLAREDYYETGGEPPGQWLGGLTKELAVHGQVRAGQLKRLLQGCHPITGEALARNAGPGHKGGWDLTFSAPKSVSVLWGIADSQQRARVAEAHDAAVQAALAYLESRAFTSRERHGAAPVHAVLAAAYQHGTSRALDPQLHTHVVVANLGRRGDGQFGALDFDARYKMAAGAMYRVELAARLRAMGYAIERDGLSFRVQEVDPAACQVFSTRRRQIVEQLQRAGFTGGKAAAVAALATRQSKQFHPRDTLFESWRATAQALGLNPGPGWTPNSVHGMPPEKQPLSAGKNQFPTQNIHDILKKLTAQASTFTPMQLEAALAVEAQGRWSAPQTETWIRETWASGLQDPGRFGLIRLQPAGESRQRGRERTRFTTRDLLTLEQDLIAKALCRRHERQHGVSCSVALASYPDLTPEQRHALRAITEQPGAVQSIRGLAGTGKSYLLQAARDTWERAGLTVFGAALSGKAADGLEQGSGIPSQTLHKLLQELTHGEKTLTAHSIVVIDEAGMLGSRLLHKILSRVHQAGAKAVLVGDPQQLQPIDAGGIFRLLSERTGYAQLSDIRRQERGEDREMIQDLLQGKVASVLDHLNERGALEIAPGKRIHQAVVSRWLAERDPRRPEESLMLAGTKAEVLRLNQLARENLIQRHQLHSEVVVSTAHGERQFAIGERMVLTRNNRSLRVRNGQMGTIKAWTVNGRGQLEFDVTLDSGKTIALDIAQYGHVDYGYAVTVHKAQGATVDRTFVLLSDPVVDREWTYVAASRHRKELRFFVPEEQATLVPEQIRRSRQKDVSLDYRIERDFEARDKAMEDETDWELN